MQIIERYKYLSEDKLVFGKINYWTMCKQLKKVMAECGIEKHISYHCARHTFGTLALSKGIGELKPFGTLRLPVLKFLRILSFRILQSI